MIGPLDTLTLARTKIRSKRLRLFVTTIVSALVFGVLAGTTILVDGMSASLARFATVNLGERYLVSGGPNYYSPTMGGGMDPSNPEMLARVEAINTEYLAERKLAAREFGITDYDARNEIPYFVDNTDPNVPPEYRRTVNPQSWAYQRYLVEQAAANASAVPDEAAFAALVDPLGATEVYATKDLAYLNLTYLVGEEDLTLDAPTPTEATPIMQSPIGVGAYTMVPDALVAPFIAPAPGTAPAGVPVLLSADDAVLVFGDQLALPKRPGEPAAQVAWFTQVRDGVRGATYTSCYRNDAERARIDQTRSQVSEIAAGRGNADYVRPSVIYALPTTPCGMVTVVEDTRTQAQRDLDDKRALFDARFAPPQAPLAEPVTFEVVGLLPSPPPANSGVDAVLSGLVGVNYGFAAVVPETSWAALPPDLKHEGLFALPKPVGEPGMYGPQANFIASFPTIEQAKTAVRNNSCMISWTPECEAMPFMLATYGTNYLAVDDITTQARPVLIALFVIAFGIATIIIWAMMGRVIADSRRETAVFRAIGAKRSDIVAVYLTYSLWVALRIVLVAALIAVGIAAFVEFRYADRATDIARLAYAVFTPAPRFSFIGLQAPLLWGIFAGIIAMSLVAITPPLLRNIRRNPIKDMRDE
ncbi:MAG: ABC transporter permease [Phycicoccus sp.]|nr:ABC transporter permease [Phycicoccus sp.]